MQPAQHPTTPKHARTSTPLTYDLRRHCTRAALCARLRPRLPVSGRLAVGLGQLVAQLTVAAAESDVSVAMDM